MTVLSKVLCGELNVRSFTPVPQSTSNGISSTNDKNKSMKNLKSFPVRLDQECIKSQNDDAWLLTPAEGNYHEFKSVSTCIVLDVLLPPYHPTNRLCTYYTYDQSLGTLDICKPPPDDTLPYCIRYRGYEPVPN